MNDLKNSSAMDKVIAVENWIKEQTQIDIPVEHVFSIQDSYAGGIYEREIFVKAGSLITGKIHKTEHLAKLVKGTMTIFGEDSKGTFTGPITFVSLPGEKRMGYAHDDVVFATYHIVHTDNIDEIERLLVVDTQQEYNDHVKNSRG